MRDRFVKTGVGVLVYKDDKVLMIKRANSHGHGTWAPPGGHIEFGESLEECAIRECQEETDIDIRNVRFKCITNDIFSEEKQYITVWMEADYLSGVAIINSEPELTEIGWYKWDNLPEPFFLPLQNLIDGKFYN